MNTAEALRVELATVEARAQQIRVELGMYRRASPALAEALGYVAQNPGTTIAGLAKGLGIDERAAHLRLYRLFRRARIIRRMEPLGQRPVATYYPAPEPA